MSAVRRLVLMILAVVLSLLGYAGPAAAADPLGNLESVGAVPGGIAIQGWAIDPDTTDPVYVWVTLDGVGRHLYADRNRPDVGSAYPAFGPDHGFEATLSAPAGAHTVCATISNVGPGAHGSLGCRTVTTLAGPPVGTFDSAWAVPGGIQIRGWTIDPETTSPIFVWVTVDGAGRHLLADKSRPDVGSVYPGYGPKHGFTTTLAAPPGAHRICATAGNVGAGSNRDLGCQTVTVLAGNPRGNLELAAGRAGRIELRGWAIDPDTTAPVYVWVTVDGAGRHVYANQTRPDVGKAYPGYGADHGFATTLTTTPGTHTVCLTISNVGAGSHHSLGCHSITTGFAATTTTIGSALADRMSTSWRPGCPVPLSDLRYLTMTYRGFDGWDHRGEMVVAASVADDVINAFRAIYASGFPIYSMRLVDDFGGDDNASMAADNTSAFNCRAVTGGTTFSRHSYGDAIDINPRENPYVLGSTVLPPSGAPYVSRPDLPGVIHEGDSVVRAFDAVRWSWGGRWARPIDYQHFSRTGG